ncbi:capsule biosynthesis protein [Marivivens donghaensis]|uniref:Capsule biosynthesis protein n=1 Tax=Marivivens donghaensis TaxID=1699413 RepID=A0ABX0W0B2_9RHOB|nr:capsule biosynthesis protein [Marivivens donghaensis]NIY73739.1 capsule biosynthesis protein [Marivivens donghaensis]
MTTKLKARKFRIRSGETLGGARAAAVDPEIDIDADPSSIKPETPGIGTDQQASTGSDSDMDAIRREGLTGRQLRMARRIAQKHGLAVTSDFDAVRQLRARGIDPFERSSILELVSSSNAQSNLPATSPEPSQQLPQTVQQQSREVARPDTTGGPLSAERRASEIQKIQQDIVRRRRRKLMSLFARLSVFVLLPTFVMGVYYFVYATPMYATKSEFVIQQAQSQSGASGIAGLFQGTSLATQADAVAVQSYLTSRSAMVRLDEEEGFKEHFGQAWIDPIQRLPEDASNETAYKVYENHVKIGYDPTEGILRMEVIAADPETSQRFSEALISYAEEQVDQLTQRMREDQMRGADQSYEKAEARRAEALARLLQIQTELQVLSPDSEAQLVLTQISQLETRRQDKILELSSLQSVARPNEARVNAVQNEIASLQNSITSLRSELTEQADTGVSLASKTTELRTAEEDYQFQVGLVQQALTMMETARLEANRQVRYLSLGVEPIAPDDPTYPRAFENTLVSLLIFAGIYLMLSLTVSILREQVTS